MLSISYKSHDIWHSEKPIDGENSQNDHDFIIS